MKKLQILKKTCLFLAFTMMLFAQTVYAQNYYATMCIMAPETTQTKHKYYIELNDNYAGSVQSCQFVEIKMLPGTYALAVYGNTTPKGTILPNTFESAKINGISIRYDSILVQAGNTYYIDVTNTEPVLSDVQAYIQALSKKAIVPGGSIDFAKKSLSANNNATPQNGKSTSLAKSKSGKTKKEETYEPIYNPVEKKLAFKVSTDDYYYESLSFQAPHFFAEYFSNDMAMNYIDSTNKAIGTLDIRCLKWDTYNVAFIFDFLDNNNNLIKTYTYEDSGAFNSSLSSPYNPVSFLPKKLFPAAHKIMEMFRHDYTRDYEQISKALLSPKPVKKVTLVVCTPSEKVETDYKCFIELDGKRIGVLPDKGVKTFEVSSGRHKIAVYGNKYKTYHGLFGFIEKINYTGDPDVARQNNSIGSTLIYLQEEINYITLYGIKPQFISREKFNEYITVDMLIDPKAIPQYASTIKNTMSSPSQEQQTNIPQTPTPQPIHISDVDKNIKQSTIKSPNTYVLIMANENYEFLGDVNYAANDGKIFKEYCVKTLGVPERQIFYYENATAGKVDDGIGKMEYCLNNFEGAKAIVYYCGHGIPDEKTGQSYLIPVDGKATSMRTCYKLTDIYKTLAATKAQSITYFMDACFTGANKEGSMLVAARGVARAPEKETLSGKTIVFSASSGDETAMTLNEEGHGLFTYYLLKKLQETNGDVTYGELADYINRNVKKDAFLINEKPQTPVVATSPAVVNSWKQMKLK